MRPSYIDAMKQLTWIAKCVALASMTSVALAGCLTDDSLDDDLATTAAERGGGGGGGGGGGPKPGVIQTTSTGVVCDDGTTLGVTLRKGVQDRVEMQLIVGSAPADQPAGYLDVRLVDQTTGAFVNGWGSWPSSFIVGMAVTNLGRTVPVGVSTLDFTAELHEGASVAAPTVVACAATIVVTAR